MKKVNMTFMAMAYLAMIATSCSNEITEESSSFINGGKQSMTFTASQEESGTTSRAAINGTDKTKIDWQSTDKIAIFDNIMTTEAAPREFSVTPDESDATKATLSGYVSEGATAYVAVYPKSAASASAVYSTDAVTVTIPTSQTATVGSFDPAAAVMTATSTGSSFEFKNVCAFLKIVTDKEYTKVEVSVASGSNIAGTFVVAPSTGVISSTTTGAQTITLAPASGTMAAGTYYVAIAPEEVTDLTIKCYTDATTYIGKAKSGSSTQTRKSVYAMGGPGTWTTGFASVLSTAGVTGNQIDWVKIGGYKWATKNLGATTLADSPETAWGTYYSWGATATIASSIPLSEITAWGQNKTVTFISGKETGYMEENDPLYNGSSYTYNPEAGTARSEGFDSYDAAKASWGNNWRMPSADEFKALADACGGASSASTSLITTSTNITQGGIYQVNPYPRALITIDGENYGVTGRLFVTTADPTKRVFLPATSNIGGTTLYYAGGYGCYWSSSLYNNTENKAYYMSIGSSSISPQSNSKRNNGLSVRAVLE